MILYKDTKPSPVLLWKMCFRQTRLRILSWLSRHLYRYFDIAVIQRCFSYCRKFVVLPI